MNFLKRNIKAYARQIHKLCLPRQSYCPTPSDNVLTDYSEHSVSSAVVRKNISILAIRDTCSENALLNKFF